MPWVDVDALRGPEAGSREALARWLEEGRILLFRRAPFSIPDADRDFLLSRRQGGGRLHKNIAYRPARDRVTGAAGSGSREEIERLRRILREYSRSALAFLAGLFPGYARSWDVDYASFRPIEEEGRELPPTSRNDRLHVDAFPTRPTHGGRILRFFTNIHPERAREWVSGGTFDRLAPRYAVGSGLLEEALRHGRPSAADRLLRAIGARRRLPSPYDAFMLRFHDFLKAERGVPGVGGARTVLLSPRLELDRPHGHGQPRGPVGAVRARADGHPRPRFPGGAGAGARGDPREAGRTASRRTGLAFWQPRSASGAGSRWPPGRRARWATTPPAPGAAPRRRRAWSGTPPR